MVNGADYIKCVLANQSAYTATLGKFATHAYLLRSMGDTSKRVIYEELVWAINEFGPSRYPHCSGTAQTTPVICTGVCGKIYTQAISKNLLWAVLARVQ